MEHQALSQTSPTQARCTLLSFTQEHIPEPKKFNPDMTWEETDHYLFMSSMYEVASIEAAIIIGKCKQLKKRILKIESKTPNKSRSKKITAPVCLTDNMIQFPGERRGTYAN